MVDVGDDGKISDFALVGQKNTPPKDGEWSSNIGVYPQEIPGGQAAGASPRPTEQGNDRGPGRRTGSPSPTHTRGDRLGISGAWHRWRPGGRSRYSAAALRACGVTAMRAARGAASSAQATDRSLSGRPESSFPPLGLLSPPNPLRSRWRLCRLTDAACPLRVLRWASAGAPVTASASQWGGRQCAVGLRPVRTAHRRREPRVQGPQVLVVFPPLLTAKAVPRPGRPAPAQARPPGDIPMDIGRPQVAPTGGQSLTLANRGRLRAWRLPYRPVGGASGMPRPTSGSGSPCGG